MSNLISFNSSETMLFLELSIIILFISLVIFIGIVIIYGNLKQKISDKLFTHVIKILIDLGILNNIPKIRKRSLYDQIFTEFNDKFDIYISNINSTFTAKLDRINNNLNNKLNEEVNTRFGKINTEFNSKLTAEAEKNKAHDDNFTIVAQKILNNITTKVNNIEEACCNDFCRINVVIKNLQNEINQHYAIVQRSNFDQQSMSNKSKANSTNESKTNSSSSSSSSGSSDLSEILDITSDIKICFKQHFDRLMKAKNYTFNEMCYSVVIDICSLRGNIKTSTVKNFYNSVSGSRVSIINRINAWVASFNNNAE